MAAIGITGKEWRKVDPEDVKEWRRLVIEEKKSYREVGRIFDRGHKIIQYHVKERPEGGAIVMKSSGWKKRPRKRTPEVILVNVLRMARGRSTKVGRVFDLNLHMMLDMYNRQEGKCALTGIPFDLSKPEKARTGAYTVSIDRINSAKGYTLDNVRLVCWAVNLGLGQWGEDVFSRIAHAYVERQKEEQ